MNSQENSNVVALRIYGYENGLENLTEQIGIEPDQTVEKGEIVKGHGKYEQSMWMFKSKLAADKTVEEHLEWMLNKLHPFQATIHSIAQQYNVQLTVGATYYEYNPEIFLEADKIASIAELGVKLWFDIYCYEKDHLATEEQRQGLEVGLKDSAVAHKLGIGTDEERQRVVNALATLEDVAQLIPDEYFSKDGLKSLDEYWQEDMLKGAQEKLTKLADQIRDSKLYIGK